MAIDKRSMRRLLACAAGFFALTLLFGAAQAHNPFALIRPQDGLGPALGLVYGWPAIAGCALGWLLGQALLGARLTASLASACLYAVYLAIPLLVWLVFGFVRERFVPSGEPGGASALRAPDARIDSSLKVALYLAAAVLGSVYMTCAFSLVSPGVATDYIDAELAFYHSFIFLAYLGLPCVLVLARRAGSQAQATSRMALGELVVALFLAVTAALAAVFFALTYGIYVMDGTFSTFEDMMMLVRTFYVVVTQITPAGLVVMMLAVRAVSRRATRPVEALTASTAAFVGDLDAHSSQSKKLEAHPIDERGMAPAAEVRELVDAVNAMERDLVTYVGELAAVTAERERVEAELDIARDIQASAIPHDFAAQAARGVAVEGFMRPAREVGGDFYDVFDLDEHRTALVIGDVSGKGVPAALFMMRALGLIRSCLMAEDDLGEALSAANDGLTERNDAMLFVTAFVCVLDRKAATLHYANAGHNPPSVVRGGVREYLRMRPGLVLGAIEGMAYAAGSMPFFPGDQILLYTDGVTEAANEADELMGEGRLEQILASLDERGERAICEAVVARIDEFAGAAPQADDITLLNLAWNLPVCSLEVEARDAELPRVLAFIEDGLSALAKEGIDTHKLAFDLKLVAEELFVNVCHHGSVEGRLPRVSLRLSVDAQARTVYLAHEDDGRAYNPLDHEVVMPTADGPVGGLGIHLVRRIMDQVSYERLRDRNVLTMAKGF